MKTTIAPMAGISCPRCGKTSQLRTHREIGSKQLQQPFYYKQWYYCDRKECLTSTFMKEEDKVWNSNERAQDMKIQAASREEESRQLSFLRSVE